MKVRISKACMLLLVVGIASLSSLVGQGICVPVTEDDRIFHRNIKESRLFDYIDQTTKIEKGVELDDYMTERNLYKCDCPTLKKLHHALYLEENTERDAVEIDFDADEINKEYILQREACLARLVLEMGIFIQKSIEIAEGSQRALKGRDFLKSNERLKNGLKWSGKRLESVVDGMAEKRLQYLRNADWSLWNKDGIYARFDRLHGTIIDCYLALQLKLAAATSKEEFEQAEDLYCSFDAFIGSVFSGVRPICMIAEGEDYPIASCPHDDARRYGAVERALKEKIRNSWRSLKAIDSLVERENRAEISNKYRYFVSCTENAIARYDNEFREMSPPRTRRVKPKKIEPEPEFFDEYGWKLERTETMENMQVKVLEQQQIVNSRLCVDSVIRGHFARIEAERAAAVREAERRRQRCAERAEKARKKASWNPFVRWG